jgi:hypothetical protein
VRIRRPLHLTLGFALAFASGCGLGSPSPISNFGDRLRGALSPDDIRADLSALQRIADANNGIRADGTPGYDASVAYVVDELRKAGYNATLQKVMIPNFRAARAGHPSGGGQQRDGFLRRARLPSRALLTLGRRHCRGGGDRLRPERGPDRFRRAPDWQGLRRR